MPLILIFVKVLLLSSVAISAKAQDQCPASTSLPNGSTLVASLVVPETGTTFYAKHGGTVNVDIKGTASIGIGTGSRDLHFSYVIDKSPSTEGSCGIPGSTKTIFECEKDAVLALHQTIEEGESALDYGVVAFDNGGESIKWNESFVTTDRGDQDGDVANAVNALTIGSGTNFAAGLKEVLNSVTESAATGQKRVIFLSDGEDQGNEQDFDAALQDLKNEGARIDSFAVGANSVCDGRLQEMADETGGDCASVVDAAELEDALQALLSSEITSVDITLNGHDITQVVGPFSGPVSMNVDSTAIGLPEGQYKVCIEATGLGPRTDPSSSTSIACCEWFYVKSAYHGPYHGKLKGSYKYKGPGATRKKRGSHWHNGWWW